MTLTERIIGRLLCFVGQHRWYVSIAVGERVCMKCGKVESGDGD